jgi:hypothetical protein
MLVCCIAIINFEKQTKGIWPIAIGEVIYQLVTHTLAIRFKDTFVEHFNPHQFGVATLNRCETMVHGIRAMLDLHLE